MTSRKSPRIAASQSFLPDEVEFLAQLLTKLLSGQDCKILLRSPQLPRVLRKVQTMQARIKAMKREKRREDWHELGRSIARASKVDEAVMEKVVTVMDSHEELFTRLAQGPKGD